MSAPRLTFLYPFLFAPARQPATVREASRTAKRAFGASRRKKQSPAHQRYGTANEPMPPRPKAEQQNDAAPRDVKVLPEPEPEAQKEAEMQQQRQQQHQQSAPSKVDTARAKRRSKIVKSAPPPQDAQEPDRPAIEALPPKTRLPPAPAVDGAETISLSGPSPQPQISAKPFETLLSMTSSDPNNTAAAPTIYEPSKPSSNTPKELDSGADAHNNGSDTNSDQPLETHKPPYISTPPYVHHFDTFGLVRRLEEGGWTQAQAVTLMKAVRLILSSNMELAQNGLVSKSNVENESYLFSAACSELTTEILTKRRAEGERSRTERTGLSHEVDILGQRMTQESATMKDELKGMFDDRKMGVRNEQRDMERKIQELNYRITVSLNSDSRSDVEGVRWLITKRAITALAICVGMILGSIKFASSIAQWEEEEKQQLAANRKKHGGNNGHGGHGNGGGGGGGGGGLRGDDANGGGGDGDMGLFEGSPKASASAVLREELGREILVRQGDNPAFVSLG